MYNLNDILVDKENTCFVRIESIPNENGFNFGYRARILAVDPTTGYPSNLTCACVNLDTNNSYSSDLNCKFQPWLDSVTDDAEIEKIKNVIEELKNITWTVPSFDSSDSESAYDSEEEVEEEESEDSINAQNDKNEIENNLFIKTLRRKLTVDSEDDDATLVPNSPKSSSMISLNSSELANEPIIATQ